MAFGSYELVFLCDILKKTESGFVLWKGTLNICVHRRKTMNDFLRGNLQLFGNFQRDQENTQDNYP